MKKILLLILALILCSSVLVGCTQAEIASNNIRKQADEFNITRKITVVNVRTDAILFEVTGTMSLQNNSHNELVVVVAVGPNQYKKHFIYLNSWTAYVVEDVSGVNIDPYHYEINIYPQRVLPDINILP